VEVIHTRGDRILDVPLARVGGKGLFVKEIEEALLDGRCDLAVHSLKDLPTTLPRGMALAALPKRSDARDVLISRHNLRLMELPTGAKIGTSSPRRAAQVLALRPDVIPINLRGNVDTRVRKAATEIYDAIVVAAAGLLRLGLDDRITEHLPCEHFLPAPGQGALAVEIRAGDDDVANLVAALDDYATRQATTAERTLVSALGGGCHTPIGAYGAVNSINNKLELHGMVASTDGKTVLRDTAVGPASDALVVGNELAQRLLAQGAEEIVRSTRSCEE
jgi:hydroxymethylbilane synthase